MKFFNIATVAAAALMFSCMVTDQASAKDIRNDRLSRPGASFRHDVPSRPDPIVQTTNGKTYGPVHNGVSNDRLSRPSASFRNEAPVRPDPIVQITSGKTYGQSNDGIKNNRMGRKGASFRDE